MADSKSVTVEPSSPFVLRSPVKATRPRAFYRLGTSLVDWLTQAKRAVGACVWHSHTQIAASLRTDTSEVFFFFDSVGILFYIATLHAVLVQPSAGQSPRGFVQVFGVSR